MSWVKAFCLLEKKTTFIIPRSGDLYFHLLVTVLTHIMFKITSLCGYLFEMSKYCIMFVCALPFSGGLFSILLLYACTLCQVTFTQTWKKKVDVIA